MEQHIDQPIRVSGTKLIVGLFFAIAGVLMTAENFDLLDAGRYLRYWPAVLLLIGLLNLADSGRRLAGVILTVVGAALLVTNAGWLHVDIVDLWPVLLIIGGIAMVARAVGIRGGGDASDERNVWAVLTARKVVYTASDFRGARVIAFMGGCELDLTRAEIGEGPAILETFAMWGGIEITVPDDWDVIGEVVPIMAGFEVSAIPGATPRKQLIVRGNALMAGIEVKRRKS